VRHFGFVKSSYSSENGECLEVARNIPRTIAVRDSERSDSPFPILTPAAWGSFMEGLRRQP
jgi:hypothetical protein